MIIGVSGKIGSGKDTIGEIIQWLTNPRIHTDENVVIGEDSIAKYVSFEDWQNGEKLSGSFTNTWETKKYAGKLKDIVCLLINCTRKELEDQEFKEKELGEDWIVWEVEGKLYTSWLQASEASFKEEVLKGQSQIRTEILTPRRILQLLGTEAGRDIIHPNIWVNSLFSTYHPNIVNTEREILAEGNKWIITDVRFLNEVEAIIDKDGINIRINRFIYPKKIVVPNGVEYIQENEDEKYYNQNGKSYEDRISYDDLIKKYSFTINKVTIEHPSETALDDYENWDYIIENNGTIEELIIKVKEILIKEKII